MLKGLEGIGAGRHLGVPLSDPTASSTIPIPQLSEFLEVGEAESTAREGLHYWRMARKDWAGIFHDSSRGPPGFP